jgi:hypothetical protein
MVCSSAAQHPSVTPCGIQGSSYFIASDLHIGSHCFYKNMVISHFASAGRRPFLLPFLLHLILLLLLAIGLNMPLLLAVMTCQTGMV